MYAAALQVCELQRGSLSGLKGRYVKAAVTIWTKSALPNLTAFSGKEKAFRYCVSKTFPANCRHAEKTGYGPLPPEIPYLPEGMNPAYG